MRARLMLALFLPAVAVAMAALPGVAQVQRVEMKIAGYLCGF